MWTTTHEQLSTAGPDQVWQVIRDVGSWMEWNDGITALTVDGPVQVGTAVTMTTPDGQILPSTIVELKEGERLSDLTVVDDVSVRVDHDVAATRDGSRITYRMTVDGPVPDDLSEQIGRAASEDFPQVLAALAHRAEQSTSGRIR